MRRPGVRSARYWRVALAVLVGVMLLTRVYARHRRRQAIPATSPSRDRVDEASWESFPASDPPGWIPDHV